MNHVVVRVWVSLIRAVSPGHVSLALDPPHSQTPETGYISFAPAHQGSVSGPGKFYSLHHDLNEYHKKHHHRGLWVGHIYGLDVSAMRQEFAHHCKHPPHYSLFNECASQVHRYLRLGGGDDFASWWNSNVLVTWSPDDVEMYAKSIIHNTIHLGSYGQKFIGEGTVF